MVEHESDSFCCLLFFFFFALSVVDLILVGGSKNEIIKFLFSLIKIDGLIILYTLPVVTLQQIYIPDVTNR